MKGPSPRALAVIAVVVLLGAAGAGIGLWAKGLAATANLGKQQAEAGARSLASMDATSAITHFREADRSFTKVRQSLGTGWVARTAEKTPWVGRQFTATRSLAQIGSDGCLGGIELAEALRESPESTATPNAGGQLGVVLTSRFAHIEAALEHVSDAAKSANSLSTEGLVPPLARAVQSIQGSLGKAAPLLDRSGPLLKLGSYLLSGSHRIIVVSMDGAELRPTGGWSGSFGIVSFGSSGVRLESYQDVFVLPDPPGRVPPPVGATQTNDFNFRNANWWLDFPTSAEKMLGFWRTYGQQPVDGIILVDTVVMSDLLEVVGPITVPQHKQTFTSENLLVRLLYLTQVVKGGQPDRKDVLVELAEQLERRVLKANPKTLLKVAQVLGEAADAKHVQLYFTDPAAEAVADELKWSGRVAPPSGTTDVVAVSNAMNKPGKVNIAMSKTIDYNVVLGADGSAETRLVLGYANTGQYYEALPGDFSDWMRVYRAPGTVFPPTNPDGSKTQIMTEFGFPAQAHGFLLHRGQSTVVTMKARVPQAVRTDSPSGRGAGLYRLYVVRQDDLEDVPTTISVTAPKGWRVTSATARFVASGKQIPVTSGAGRVVLSAPLSGDLTLDVELTRQ